MNDKEDVVRMPTIFQYFSQFKPIYFKKGDIIQRPDLPNLNIFYIEIGCIKKYSITKSGEENIITFYKNHNIFPIVKLFQNTSTHLYAEAMMDTSIRSVNESDFKQFIKSSPKAMMELVSYLLEHAEKCYRRIENLEFITSYPRVMFNLLSLAENFGKPDNKKITIDLELTQNNIASTTAMTRETVGRELEKLNKEEIICCKNKTIVINDVDMLIKKMDNYQEIDWQIDKN